MSGFTYYYPDDRDVHFGLLNRELPEIGDDIIFAFQKERVIRAKCETVTLRQNGIRKAIYLQSCMVWLPFWFTLATRKQIGSKNGTHILVRKSTVAIKYLVTKVIKEAENKMKISPGYVFDSGWT